MPLITVTHAARRADLAKRKTLKTAIDKKWKIEKKETIAYLTKALETASCGIQTACVSHLEAVPCEYGYGPVDGVKYVSIYTLDPNIKFIEFNMGSMGFKIPNTRDAINKTIRAIKKPQSYALPSFRSISASSSAVGRWPYKPLKIQFTNWAGCKIYNDGWIMFRGCMAWKSNKSPELAKKMGFESKVDKDLIGEGKRITVISNPIPITPAYMGRDHKDNPELVIMKDAANNEYLFEKKLFLQLLTLLDREKPKSKTRNYEFKIIAFVDEKNGALGVFDDNGEHIGMLGPFGIANPNGTPIGQSPH